MQSFSPSSIETEVLAIEPIKINTDVQHLEKLLNKIFGDELEKTGVDASEISNLIEFPLKEELDFSPEQTSDIFAPTFSSPSSPSSPKILKSIMEEDDHADSDMQYMVEAQRKELVQLRHQLKEREYDIRSLDLQLAANADQLKFMPELFNKALMASELKVQLVALQEVLEVEQLAHEQSRDLLFKTQARVDRIKDTFWYRLGRNLGFNLE